MLISFFIASILMNPLVKSRFWNRCPWSISELDRGLNISIGKKIIQIKLSCWIVLLFIFNLTPKQELVLNFFLALIQLSKHFYNRRKISTGQQCDHWKVAVRVFWNKLSQKWSLILGINFQMIPYSGIT